MRSLPQWREAGNGNASELRRVLLRAADELRQAARHALAVAVLCAAILWRLGQYAFAVAAPAAARLWRLLLLAFAAAAPRVAEAWRSARNAVGAAAPPWLARFGRQAEQAWALAVLWAAARWRLRRARPNFPAVTILAWIGVLALGLYIGLAALVYFAQRSLMYFPDTSRTTPAAAGFAEAEELTLTASDGQPVTVWHVAPRNNKPVILYFHGNGGALKYRVERFHKLIADGIGLVAVEYRGYGGSPGSPSEDGLIADAQAAYAFAAARYTVKQLVPWGESLGSGVATALAAEQPVGRLILEAPFTSAAEIGAEHYWYLPVRFLMKDQFRSDERIASVTAPLIILHGVLDKTVPFAMGERLFNLANKPKRIVRFLDGHHEDLDANGALIAVARFLAGDMD